MLQACGLRRAAVSSIILLVSFCTFGLQAAADTINAKPLEYKSDANTQKIAVSLLELEKTIKDQGITIPEACADTAFSVSNETLVVDIITTPAKISDSVLSAKFALPNTVIRDYFPVNYRMVALVSDLADLHALAAIDEVVFIKPQYLPQSWTGSVDSLANVAMGVADVQDEFLLDGFGQKVGIIANSFALTDNVRDAQTQPGPTLTGNLTNSIPQQSGDLPPTVQLLRDNYPYDNQDTTDEGAAMGEVIYDIAPGAALAFATGAGGDGVFADSYRKLTQAGCTVIADGMRYADEPMYQAGIIGMTASEQISKGVTCVSAAGNLAQQGFTQTFKDVNPNVQMTRNPPDGNDLHDWGGGNGFLPVTVPANQSLQVVLQWNQPFTSVSPLNGAQIDLDLYVTEAPLVSELATTPYRGIDQQGNTNKPLGDAFEMQNPIYTNTSGMDQTVYIAVNEYQGSSGCIPQASIPVEFKIVFWQSGPGVTVGLNGPTIYGHTAIQNMISCGAVPWYGLPSCDSGTPTISFPEPFTSRGGALSILFSGKGSYSPYKVNVPLIASADGMNTTFFGEDDSVLPVGVPGEPDGNPNFFGTSASAASAGGIAALVRQASSSARVADVYTRTACDVIGSPAWPGWDDFTGYGAINAYSAVSYVNTGVNLALVQPAGWSDRVVISEEPDAVDDAPYLCAGSDILVNFSVANTGGRKTPGKFDAQVMVDGRAVTVNRRPRTLRMGPLAPGETADATNFSIGTLPVGVHTVSVVVNPKNRVRETNKTDNRFDKQIVVTAPPQNDPFIYRTQLGSSPGSVSGSNACATKEAGEPNHAGNPGGSSVWFKWTAPVTDKVGINTIGSNFDTLLAVYTGTAVNALTPVASNDNDGANTYSHVTFQAIAGTEYQIAIDGKNGEQGSFVMTWEGHPGNDPFAARFPIAGCGGNFSSSNVMATKEPGEPNHAGNVGGSSVWYSWIAPVGGTATFTLTNTTFSPLLAAYTGTAVNALTPVGSGNGSMSFPVTAGVQYQIAVDGADGSEGTFKLTWDTAIENDMFAQRTVITACTGVISSVNGCATKETGEPNHAGNAGGKSLWFSWTAPLSSTITFETAGSSFDTLLAVYTGNSVSALTLVAENNNFGSLTTSRVVFQATAGTEYQIAVDGFNGASGNVTLRWTPATNDPFSGRIAIGTCEGSTTATNICATTEPGEPVHSPNETGASLWYTYTAPSTDHATLSLAGSAINAVVAVYTGESVGALTLVASGVGGCTFSTTANNRYQVAVDGLNGERGVIQLSWTSRPANDPFAGAIALDAATTGSVTAVTTCASKETGEPDHAGNSGGKSVWYTYTATNETSLTLDTFGSSYDTLLAVYTGSAVNALTALASNNDYGSSKQSRVTISTTTGTVYRIAADGFNGASGTLKLTRNTGLVATNDLFTSAVTVTAATGSVSGNNVLATKETGEPNHAGNAGGKSVWYKWVAPTTGSVSFTMSTYFNSLLAAYTGTAVSALTTVTSATGASAKITFTATAGVTYYIAVDGTSGQSGTFTLNWAYN